MFSQQNEPYCVLIQTFAKICKSPGFSYGEGRTFLNLGPSLDFEGKHYWYSPPHTLSDPICGADRVFQATAGRICHRRNRNQGRW